MKVWLLVVDGRVDSVWTSNNGRVVARLRRLKETQSRLNYSLQEKTVQGEEEE